MLLQPSVCLQAQPELVRPKVRHRRVVDVIAADDAFGYVDRLIDGVGPVLHPHRCREERIPPARYVTGGIDPGSSGAIGGAPDPVTQVESTHAKPVHSWFRADGDDDQARLEHRAVSQDDSAHSPRVGDEGAHAGERCGNDGDAHAAMQRHELGADRPTDDTLEQVLACCEQDHLTDGRLEDRCDLRTEEAAADDHDALPDVDFGTQRLRVLQGTQDVDSSRSLRPCEAPRTDARRDHQCVITGSCPIRGRHLPTDRVEVDGRRAEPLVDVERREMGIGSQLQPRPLPLTREELLRERRPIVCVVPFCADHLDGSGVSLATKRLRCCHSGCGGADDEGASHTHGAWRRMTAAGHRAAASRTASSSSAGGSWSSTTTMPSSSF